MVNQNKAGKLKKKAQNVDIVFGFFEQQRLEVENKKKPLLELVRATLKKKAKFSFAMEKLRTMGTPMGTKKGKLCLMATSMVKKKGKLFLMVTNMGKKKGKNFTMVTNMGRKKR